MSATAVFWAGSDDFSGWTILAWEGDKKLHAWEGLPSGGEGWFLVTDPNGRMIDANDPDQSLFLN